jgi:hypothetical protein
MMRDPSRIGPILWKLSEAWKADPDLRLGQLVYIAAQPATDVFSVEDGALERGLDRLLSRDRLRDERSTDGSGGSTGSSTLP